MSERPETDDRDPQAQLDLARLFLAAQSNDTAMTVTPGVLSVDVPHSYRWARVGITAPLGWAHGADAPRSAARVGQGAGRIRSRAPGGGMVRAELWRALRLYFILSGRM